MDKESLKSRYDSLLKDEDFDKLDLGLKNPNIFQILRITKNEIRHSNFLSWLLDPNQSHKLAHRPCGPKTRRWLQSLQSIDQR